MSGLGTVRESLLPTVHLQNRRREKGIVYNYFEDIFCLTISSNSENKECVRLEV